MNEVKITITGPGTTFGAITKVIELLLIEVGADVKVELDHQSATMTVEEAKNNLKQVSGRKITIKTESLPWGG